MDRWQTTVRGDTLGKIMDAARAEVTRFFQVGHGGDQRGFELDINPESIIVDGRGGITHITYEATVTVEW